MAIEDQVKQIEAEALSAIAAASDEAALEAIRVAELGKKGRLSLLMRDLGSMSPEERKTAGPALNGLKDRLTNAINARKGELELVTLNKRLETEREDLTLPPRPEPIGALHPVMQVFEELAAIFADMGFAVAEGPDIEDDFHNFTALNFPPGHPARETHDTFFLKPDAKGEKKVLRTHTSPVQIRSMVSSKPPIRVIAPGRVFRKDWDATHTPMFHQIEGLVVDDKVHMGHLKSCLTEAFSRFFEVPTTQSRFRPHFFPFTEPSAEMDIRCDRSGGEIKVGAEAVGRFDPSSNHFIWVLPPGIHGEGPWTLNVTVKHRGEVKFESKVPLKPEIIPAGTYTEFPAGAEAIRLNDAGEWQAKMAEVGKVVEDLIAKHGRGDGEVVMMTEINTALDDAGKQAYCAGKKTPDIRAYLEEGSPPKLTAIDMTPMQAFIQGEVQENCPA